VVAYCGATYLVTIRAIGSVSSKIELLVLTLPRLSNPRQIASAIRGPCGRGSHPTTTVSTGHVVVVGWYGGSTLIVDDAMVLSEVEVATAVTGGPGLLIVVSLILLSCAIEVCFPPRWRDHVEETLASSLVFTSARLGSRYSGKDVAHDEDADEEDDNDDDDVEERYAKSCSSNNISARA
jgi:hypothetical protein